MAIFHYKAMLQGQRNQGEIDAASTDAALRVLSQRGMTVYEITRAKTIGGNVSLGSWKKDKIKSEEILLAIQELSTLLNAGIPLADSLHNIARGHEDKALGIALRKAYNTLREGATLAKALNASGLTLPDYVHELVRAGEETGKLGASLQSAATQMEADARFRRETRNALTYPMVLIASGLLATLVVFVFVVPKFANILTNPKADIPAMSRWVLESGLWLVQNKLLAALAFTGLIAGVVSLFSQPTVRMKIWESAGQWPITGPWLKHIEVTRWASMFAVLLEHHVPILDALTHSRNSLTGERWRHKADMLIKDLKSGKSLAAAMSAHQFLDPMGINLIRVGEQSGRLPQTTASLAQMHRTHAEQSMKQFLVLLEPITILLVSTLLGGIMISVMLAITSLTNVI
jgi:general secretion pathway protein F